MNRDPDSVKDYFVCNTPNFKKKTPITVIKMCPKSIVIYQLEKFVLSS